MPSSISLNKHIVSPLKLNHQGNSFKVGHPTRLILISIAIGLVTLGMGGVVAFFVMTLKDKKDKLKLINSFIVLSKNPQLSSHMKLEEAQKILKYAVLFFESDQGKKLNNVENHLQKLKSIVKISYKQKDLVKFIDDHQQHSADLINAYLHKKTGIVFHHGMPYTVTKTIGGQRVTEIKKQDSRQAIVDSPIAYAKSFLIADRNFIFPQFTRGMLTRACLEANYEQLITEWLMEEEGFVDLVKDPEGNINKTIFQIIAVYFNFFKKMELREFLKDHPEKRHLDTEILFNDVEFNKLITKERFVAFLKNPKNDILPFTPKNGEFTDTVDSKNISAEVDKIDATLGGMF